MFRNSTLSTARARAALVLLERISARYRRRSVAFLLYPWPARFPPRLVFALARARWDEDRGISKRRVVSEQPRARDARGRLATEVKKAAIARAVRPRGASAVRSSSVPSRVRPVPVRRMLVHVIHDRVHRIRATERVFAKNSFLMSQLFRAQRRERPLFSLRRQSNGAAHRTDRAKVRERAHSRRSGRLAFDARVRAARIATRSGRRVFAMAGVSSLRDRARASRAFVTSRHARSSAIVQQRIESASRRQRTLMKRRRWPRYSHRASASPVKWGSQAERAWRNLKSPRADHRRLRTHVSRERNPSAMRIRMTHARAAHRSSAYPMPRQTQRAQLAARSAARVSTRPVVGADALGQAPMEARGHAAARTEGSVVFSHAPPATKRARMTVRRRAALDDSRAARTAHANPVDAAARSQSESAWHVRGRPDQRGGNEPTMAAARGILIPLLQEVLWSDATTGRLASGVMTELDRRDSAEQYRKSGGR